MISVQSDSDDPKEKHPEIKIHNLEFILFEFSPTCKGRQFQIILSYGHICFDTQILSGPVRARDITAGYQRLPSASDQIWLSCQFHSQELEQVTIILDSACLLTKQSTIDWYFPELQRPTSANIFCWIERASIISEVRERPIRHHLRSVAKIDVY